MSSFSNKIFNGEHRGFYPWKNLFLSKLRSKGISHVISERSRAPTRPNASYLADPRTATDNQLIYQFEVRERVHEIECETAIGFLQETVGPDLMQRFDHILNDTTKSSGDIAKSIYIAICTTYAKDTTHLVAGIENELNICPPARTAKEAVKLIDTIARINNELNAIPKTLTAEEEAEFQTKILDAAAANPPRPVPARPTCKISDAEIRKLLYRKLLGESFTYVIEEINKKMSSFAEISEMVRNTSTRMSINDHYETPVQEVTSSINKVNEDSKHIVKDDKNLLRMLHGFLLHHFQVLRNLAGTAKLLVTIQEIVFLCSADVVV